MHGDNKEELFMKWGSVRSLIEGERAYDASASRDDVSESSKQEKEKENIKSRVEWLLVMGKQVDCGVTRELNWRSTESASRWLW